MTVPLSTWKDGAAKDAILGYVEETCAEGSAGWVPPEERVAVFDNDGTLWCEKPMPIQLDFVLRRLAEMAELDPSLRDRQPWKAAHERDRAHGTGLTSASIGTSSGNTVTRSRMYSTVAPSGCRCHRPRLMRAPRRHRARPGALSEGLGPVA